MAKIKSERLYYLDFLRIFSTFAVVLLHVAAQNWSKCELNTLQWYSFNFYDSIVRWCVPIFIMISGALFLDNNKPVTYKGIFKKNIFRIVVSMLFWSLIYVLYSIIRFNLSFTEKSFYKIIEGHYHMWYIFAIIGLYLIVPILRKITEDKRITKQFITLGVIFTFVIPRITNFIKLVDIKSLEQLNTSLTNMVKDMHFHLTLGYVVYFVLGYYLMKYDVSKKVRSLFYVLGLLSVITIIISTNWYSNRIDKPATWFYEYLSICTLITSVSIFLFAKYVLSKIKLKKKTTSVILALSKYSFGVYLCHPLFISILKDYFELTTVSFNPVLSVPVLTLLIFLLSLFVSFIFNKIPFINKYFI